MSVKLAQLPTDQGKLIEKAQKIGEQLKQLDSIVYDWANKDIIKSMGDVKDNLAKPDTGKPAQVAEKHTEDQLQAMIDSLVEKIKDKSKFDQRNGGGGGGGGSQKPKLPTEAELRLLKKNQEAINDGTVEADKQKEKDKEELLALGGPPGRDPQPPRSTHPESHPGQEPSSVPNPIPRTNSPATPPRKTWTTRKCWTISSAAPSPARPAAATRPSRPPATAWPAPASALRLTTIPARSPRKFKSASASTSTT